METPVFNNRILPILFMFPLIFSAALASAQIAPTDVTREITRRGTVEAVDHTLRTVRIREDGGNVVTLDIPQSIPFDRVKVGDVVSVSYFDRVSVRAKPAGEPDVERTEPPVTTATAGDLPGASVASRRVTTVTITGWDPATRTLSFKGPTGTSYSRHLADTTPADILTGLKVGDRVDVTRTEAVSLAMESSATTPPAPPPSDDFRHRLTISALWGPDNQFSGNMLKSATGSTTTGQPINIHETTFDQVYGRMTNFTLGVGYRTSPRTEGVFNFIVSRSSAETVNIGTAGSTPLNVQFDDYNYWGIEGGQRFYFTRVRLTPYVGYLVGLNRHGDIRGTFVDVPPEATPGLAAQDGKFFEKSWAFSVAPTGGLLIGVGPFEIMAETQIRYTGGLSDVDWLIEEGLRDVNSESSRWSVPFQVGMRIRF